MVTSCSSLAVAIHMTTNNFILLPNHQFFDRKTKDVISCVQWRSQKFGLWGAVGQFWLKSRFDIKILYININILYIKC